YRNVTGVQTCALPILYVLKKQHVILIAIIILFIYSSTDVVYTSKRAKHDDFQYTPTVFLHGYKGTYYSFGNMLDRYQNEYGWGEIGRASCRERERVEV